ncbi:MAG: twin-arginine translocase TatA/TatE family subunit [Deltaproteobacteria bacterium]|nr:twin-arginine translocase TatA/TatE family subunit [Deltaproteobacteria bacterium]
MFGIGTAELLIILVIVVIIFGAGKLPQIGDGLGKAVKGLKKGFSGEPLDTDKA